MNGPDSLTFQIGGAGSGFKGECTEKLTNMPMAGHQIKITVRAACLAEWNMEIKTQHDLKWLT